MKRPWITFLLSFLVPGLGYLQRGNRLSFYRTTLLFFLVLVCGTTFRLVTSFEGLAAVLVALFAVHLFALAHSTLVAKRPLKRKKASLLLKLAFTFSFLFILGVTFANKRSFMGFDILYMAVPAMQPTLTEGDRCIVNTWSYKKKLPQRGDVVVHAFRAQDGLYVNRIIAVERDRIEIRNGTVWVNGQRLLELYVYPANVIRPESREMKLLIIPEGNYFVMGDNRDASFGDSRFSGTIPKQYILGKVTDIVYAQNRTRIGKTIK